MAPAQPRRSDPKPDKRTKPKTPRRPLAGVKEPHRLANKRRGKPNPAFDLAVSAVVESKLAAAGWGRYEFAEAIGTTYDRIYGCLSGRRPWPAWLLNDIAHGLGTTTDAILILAGQEAPRSTLRQAISSARELDDRGRDLLLATLESLTAGTTDSGHGSASHAGRV